MPCASVNNNSCLCLISETIIICSGVELTSLIKVQMVISVPPEMHFGVVGDFFFSFLIHFFFSIGV